MEYTRARLVLRRETQDYPAQCCFVRVPSALDAKDNARIVMRGRRRRLAEQKVLLQALLSLAHKETALTKPDEIIEVAIVDPQVVCTAHSALDVLADCTRQLSGCSIPETDESFISTCLAHTKKQSSCPQLEPNAGQEVQQQCDATVEAAAACKPPPMTTEDSPAQPASLNKKKKKPKGKSKSESDKPTAPAPKAHLLLRRTALTQGIPPMERGEPPQRKIRVSPSAAQVFTTLFDRSELRSGLHWASFEAAMAELNFRITPRQGSSFLFEPPEDLALQSSLTVHRPHGPRVEGFRKLNLSQRLARTFGWDAETFVAR